MIITAIYTIGVLSALYAALLAPERASTAIMASGLINGVATILLVIFIDPKVSVIADDVVNQRGSYQKLKTISLLIVTSSLFISLLVKIFSTLFAHLFLMHRAKDVGWFTQFIV